MRICFEDNRINDNGVFSAAKRTVRRAKINSVFNKVCEKSPFVGSVRTDVKDSLGAFTDARKEILERSAKQALSQNDAGIFKKSANFLINQAKGFGKGAFALAQKAGPIPAIFATAGFCTACPGATTIGLTLGVVVKNLLKVLKNIKF